MEVWRFRNRIFKPMAWEFGYRDTQERKAARDERRPHKEPPYPEAGIWDRKTDKITYPGYDKGTLKKVQKQAINE